MSSTGDLLRSGAPAVLMVASGFAGLGYQLVWTQQCAAGLGHEAAAMLAVVAAFFGGLALGGLVLGTRIERSEHPLHWYAGCELAVAVWASLLLLAGSRYGAWVQRLIGAEPSASWQWFVAFLSTFALLLPATAAMGATLPAMERLCAPLSRSGRSIAAFYAGNTSGAVLGALAMAFWLIPSWGLARSAALCIALNLLCSLVAFTLLASKVPVASSAPRASGARGMLLRLAVTGFLGIGYEVLVVRVLSQVTENTVYTFALLLAMYLIGTAAGAAAYRRWLEAKPDREAWSDRLLAGVALLCLLGTVSLWSAEAVQRWLLDALGVSVAAALAAEAMLALMAFAAPTLAMGALFSHLCRSAAAVGVSFGQAFGVNTAGAALAPLLCAVVLAPLLGAKFALLAISTGYLALTTRRARAQKTVYVPALATVALAALAPPLRFVDVPDGGRLVEYREGALGAVSVVEDAEGVQRLRINNRQQEGSSASRHVDARQAWLPLLFHPAPLRVLFLGLGTGVTAASAAEDPTLEVEAVELLPEVIAASHHFSPVVGEQASARVRAVVADARRFVRASDGNYDVIVSDNFHPARSGSGALYTVEHFNAVRERLAGGGLYCQWLPLHQLDTTTLRSIARSFITVFPRGWAVLASNSLDTPVLGLMGNARSGQLDISQVRARLADVALPERIAGLGFVDEFALLGSIVAGPSALARFGGGAPINTDDRPIVAYSAPRITYAPDSRPRDRLIQLLHELSSEPDELFVPTADPAWPGRLAAYWRARAHYIESGRDVRASARVEDMLAQVREPLLSALRTSPDFQPAYDPLLSMALALARSNVSDARALLSELAHVQPARPEASRALTLLGDSTTR